jgi:hypothetical protein
MDRAVGRSNEAEGRKLLPVLADPRRTWPRRRSKRSRRRRGGNGTDNAPIVAGNVFDAGFP